MADDYKGYRGKALSVLKISTRLFGAMLKSKLQKEITRASFFPLETADSLHIVIKMPIGYNIGLRQIQLQIFK